jgi:hypothetical protein
VQALVRDDSNPRPEDIECLVKLLTTVGALLDGTQKPELRTAMNVYFTRLGKLRVLDKLESRIRFMIQARVGRYCRAQTSFSMHPFACFSLKCAATMGEELW